MQSNEFQDIQTMLIHLKGEELGDEVGECISHKEFGLRILNSLLLLLYVNERT